MPVQNPNVIGIGKMLSFALLRHDVADVDNLCFASAHGLADVFNHQIRQNAREKAPGSKHDLIGIKNRIDNFLLGLRFAAVSRRYPDIVDRLAGSRNFRFA